MTNGIICGGGKNGSGRQIFESGDGEKQAESCGYFCRKSAENEAGLCERWKDEERSGDGRLFPPFSYGTEIGKIRAVIEWEKTV